MASGMIHITLEASARPKKRLSDTMESRSKALMTRVTSAEVTGIAARTRSAALTGRPSTATRRATNRKLETARGSERVGNEGRTNRWRYRRASCSVAEPYR